MAIMDNLNQNTAERIRETENLLGKNDISDIADGTVTGAIVEFGGSIKETTENTLPGSVAGGLRVIDISGNSVQDGTPTKENPIAFKNAAESGALRIVISGTNEGESNEINISLNEPFRKCDKITRQNGVWGILKGTKVITFGGTWKIRDEFEPTDNSNTYSSADFITDNKKSTDGIYMACSHLVFGGGVVGGADIKAKGKKGCFYKIMATPTTGGTTTYICSDAETLDAFLAEMENAVFEYELATPIFTAFPVEVQIALNSLLAYNGTTTIETSGEVAPIIRVEYGKNKIGAYTLQSLLDTENCKIKLEEINKALPYAISINDDAKTIDFVDR